MEYFDQLLMFLEQAVKTTSQAKKHYLPTYNGLQIKVSFGQGHLARVPWIAFLKEPNTVRKGIYPVYLFFKDQKKLVLAFGVSEASLVNSWKIDSPVTISEHFKGTSFETESVKYGNSFLFKMYKIDNLDRSEINRDLKEILEIYARQ